MKFVLVLIVCACMISACGAVRKPSGPGRHAYRVQTPDSLQGVKDNLMKLYYRWGAGAFVNFTLSDSASEPLFVNDSLWYRNELFTVSSDSVQFGEYALHRPTTLLAVRDRSHARVITPPGIRPWIIFQALDELCDELGEGERAFVLMERNQPVVRMQYDGGTWKTSLNVFAERRDFVAQAALSDAFFDFKGGRIDYDPSVLSAMIHRYPENKVRQHRPTICVYPDFETKARINHNVMEYSFDLDSKTIHIVKDRLATLRFCEIVSEYFARQIHGDDYPWLTLGLAMQKAGTWFGKPFSWWDGKKSLLRLCDRNELLQPKTDSQNTLLTGYLSILFWQSQTAPPEAVFRQANLYITQFKPLPEDLPIGVIRKDQVTYLKGVCYAHTNGVNSGYMSRKSAESIVYLKTMGVNAISATPFGYSKTDTSSQIFFILDEMWDETLSGLYKVSGDAHDQNIRVMMKPHLWLGNGQWCGDINVPEKNQDEWETAYTRFITYHALIAELAGMEFVCVGVELPHMTSRTDMWRRIIRHVRVAFSGHLTFGGNWHEEYEQIQFWDDLDFIGIQQYYPLANKDDYTEDEVRSRVRELMSHFGDIGKRWNRPVVFTEVGFPSIKGAFKSPHREDFGQPLSEEAQELGYRLLMEESRNMISFKGFFWWKCESDEEARRRSVKSFSFKGKKAELTVRENYEE